MKTKTIIITSLLILPILAQAYFAMETKKTPKQPYTIKQEFPDFEIRFYPPAIMATVQSTATTYKEMAGPGFRKLAGFIFGGNETSASIAMTAPVRMEFGKDSSSMSFVMPGNMVKADVPAPKDASIRIETSEPEYVAAMRFGGYASDHDIEKYSKKLAQALEENGISHHGNFRFLGYNAPFQVIFRRNEVIVGVDWKE